MTNEEYLKQIAKHVQRNSEGKGIGNYLSPRTEKVDIQFFKKQKKNTSSHDKYQFKIFEEPDFIFSYIDHDEDYWFLNDNDPSYEDYLDDNCETITIFDEDADLDFPEHRSFNFLEKCLEHKKINDKYASLISMAKNIEEIRWGNKVQYTEVMISKQVDLTQFQNDLFESNFKVNFVLDTF
tara:strand:+ start:88 stop:630 length:543 start_codon:yes stop_codon:yes gene_type:complete